MNPHREAGVTRGELEDLYDRVEVMEENIESLQNKRSWKRAELPLNLDTFGRVFVVCIGTMFLAVCAIGVVVLARWCF